MDIELMQISIQFDHSQVLDQVNMSFIEGKINCLMGPSGKGKTTILNIIMDLLKPDGGEVLGVQGKQIAVVFQEDRLIEHWDAVKNVKLVCDTLEEEHIRQEFLKVGVEDVKDKPVRDFSGGMRRRVAIVRAILAKSDLLILDEPFRGLDASLKGIVIDYIKSNTVGKTVIVVTHELEDVKLLEGKLITLE